MRRLSGEVLVLGKDVVRHGLVVDNGIGIAGKHVEDGVARGIEGRDLGPLDLLGVGHRSRAELNGNALSFKVLEVGDARRSLRHDDREAGLIEGDREENALAAFGRDREARCARIERARKNARDDRVEAERFELEVLAHLLSHGLHEVNLKTLNFTGLRVVELKGREGAFSGDAPGVGGCGSANHERGDAGKSGAGEGREFHGRLLQQKSRRAYGPGNLDCLAGLLQLPGLGSINIGGETFSAGPQGPCGGREMRIVLSASRLN